MINRGLNKTSQYVFNAKTGMLEKIEEAASTVEALSKNAKNITNLDDINTADNQNDKQEPINNIVVITSDDNLIHNYFYDLDISWDASNCLSSAIIKMPKMDTENVNYWATYQGQLTIYIGHDFVFDYVNSNSYGTEQDAANALTKYWDNSDILPLFKGEISRIKERENDITIYVDSIGRRFQQKIPDEFRQAYIYNQNVRDAFQAICEFLGVKYICPPKTVVDNSETQQTADNPQAPSDADDKLQQEQNMANIVANKTANESNNSNNSENNNNGDNSDNNGENSNDNGENAEDLTNNQEIEMPQNGYSNINFDANGAIVYNSKMIETSPDMVQTLLAMEENPLEKYVDDETGIVEDVQALLEGHMFDELHNNVMNYNSVTIPPKASSTSTTEPVDNSEGTDNEETENEETETPNGAQGNTGQVTL